MTKTIMDAEVPLPIIRPKRFVEADQRRPTVGKTITKKDALGTETKSKFKTSRLIR